MDTGRERQASAAVKDESRPETTMLLEEVLRRENLITAYRKVRANKGAPGIDGMTVDDLGPYLTEGGTAGDGIHNPLSGKEAAP